MKKHIAEELPARQNPQASQSRPGGDQKPQSGGDQKPGQSQSGGSDSVDKQVRQAIYDIRYRARRENISLEQAYSQYIANSNLPQEAKMRIKEALFPKGGEGGGKEEASNESYTSHGVDLAEKSLSNAFYKVFVEGVEEKVDEDALREAFTKGEGEGKKYKVKVTDKNGRSYVRWANREKVATLRANPNIQSVEMTDYGDTYEGDEDEGKKAKKDYDGDGKVETSTQEWKGSRDKAIKKAMAKEEFIGEVAMDQEDPTLEELPIDVMIGKNKVKVAKYDAKAKNGMPMFESSLEKYMSMAKARLSGACPKCEKNPCECDTRDRKTELSLLKNKIRALGIKNPMMVNPPEGEDAMKVMTSSTAKMACEDTIVEKRRSDKEDPESDPNPQEGGKMKDDKAYQHVAGMIRDMQGRPKGQRKKKRGEKDEKEGGKYSRMAGRKRDLENKAEKAGYKSKEDYLDTMARYGGEENRKKGRGLGS
jgi:hypothetical protein